MLNDVQDFTIWILTLTDAQFELWFRGWLQNGLPLCSTFNLLLHYLWLLQSQVHWNL